MIAGEEEKGKEKRGRNGRGTRWEERGEEVTISMGCRLSGFTQSLRGDGFL